MFSFLGSRAFVAASITAVALAIPMTCVAARTEGTVLAQSSPTPTASPSSILPTARPKPTAIPNGFSYRGFIRAYDFFRDNTSNNTQSNAATAVDQGSFNSAVALHVEDTVLHGLTGAVSGIYANPFDDHCSQLADQFVGSPCVTQNMPALRPDDTLPGYELSTIYEAYLGYRSPSLSLKVGDQVFTSPWANPSDTRLKPVAFQGADLAYTLNNAFSVEVADMLRFQNRTSNVFDQTTLLTSFTPVTGLGGSVSIPSNIYDPQGLNFATPGFLYGRLGYAYGPGSRVTANFTDYVFESIANAAYGEVRYQIYPKSRFKPFIAAQGGIEKNIGQAVIGKVDSSVEGAQFGLNFSPRITVTAGYDRIPVRVDPSVNLGGTELACSATSHTIGLVKGQPFATGSLPYFLPSGGTANCTANADGTADIYYGGWASPYTFSYATDPLYTTSLTQGMVDRGSPGDSYKLQTTYSTIDKKLVTYVSYAHYRYSNPGYAQITGEVDYDLSYYFRHPPATGAYKGLSFRYRYGDRFQQGNAFYGGSPDFRYNRFQLEYDL